MKVTLAKGREFIIWSVSGTDDDLKCRTKICYDQAEYTQQDFNNFWNKITSLTPEYFK